MTRANPDLLALADVAARLRLTEGQIRWRVARGRLPAPITIPGVGQRWSASAIARWA